MFYIAYKSDGTTACKKQISLSRLTEVGKTKSGVTLYCTPSTENDGAPYRWFYTVEGIPDLLDRANISPYAEPEQIRTILDGMSESQAAQVFPDAAAKLEQIKLAIVNKGWTSNADALFCEICGDFATANTVRLNRAEYRARQNEEEEKKAAAEQERIAKQNAEEKLAELSLYEAVEEPYFDNDNLRKKYWILKSAFVSVWTEDKFGKIKADGTEMSLFNGRHVPTKYIKNGTTLLRYVLRADETRP